MIGLTDTMLAELGEPNRSKTAQGASIGSSRFSVGGRGWAPLMPTDFLVTTALP